MQTTDSRLVKAQTDWSLVANDLCTEDLKLKSYDRSLLTLAGEVEGRRILDYGCGPGLLLSALLARGADVCGFDISEEMCRLARAQISADTIYSSLESIPQHSFDLVICNLVLCIVDDNEAFRIASNIKKLLADDGVAFIGFCNPLIFNVEESQLDVRKQHAEPYEINHQYLKIKKEGGYRIVEQHRPIEWYARIFEEAGLAVRGKSFSPEYQWQGHSLQDFIIFSLESSQA